MLDRMLLNNPVASEADWMGVISETGRQGFGSGIAVDSLGNTYVCGQDFTADFLVGRGYLAKFNPAGELQWQRALGSTTANSASNFQSVAVDAAGNAYVVGNSNTAGTVRILLAKYDTAGTLQWQRLYGFTSGNGSYGRGIALDSSGNIHICGYWYDGSYNSIWLVVKINSSGTITWQRSLPHTMGSTGAYGLAVDSGGNVYVCGDSYDANVGKNSLLVAVYGSGGGLQWQRILGDYSVSGRSVALDSNSNIYVCGYAETFTNNYEWQFYLAKINTAAQVLWQRTLNSSSADYGYGVSVDSSGNPYIVGTTSVAGDVAVVAKYDTSGTLQWARQVQTSVGLAGNAIFADAAGKVHIFGQMTTGGAAPYSFFAMKVPGSGAKTGTYSVGGYNITYNTPTLTSTSRFYANTQTSFSHNTPSLTTTTPTLPDAAAGYSAQVTTI